MSCAGAAPVVLHPANVSTCNKPSFWKLESSDLRADRIKHGLVARLVYKDGQYPRKYCVFEKIMMM